MPKSTCKYEDMATLQDSLSKAASRAEHKHNAARLSAVI